MNNDCNCCPQLVPQATVAVTEGSTVTITVPQPTTAPVFGQCYRFMIPATLPPTTGQEVVSVVLGGVTAELVDNCGRTIPAQMLQCKPCAVYLIQFGVAGTTNVYYARRGFCPRRTTTVAPAASA